MWATGKEAGLMRTHQGASIAFRGTPRIALPRQPMPSPLITHLAQQGRRQVEARPLTGGTALAAHPRGEKWGERDTAPKIVPRRT